MTEEQLDDRAEEYVKKNSIYRAIKKADGTYGAEKISSVSIYQAFIDGYHECEKEHEWHDLEKDPTDLPKHNNSVLAYCRGDYYDVCFFNGKRLIGHGESDFLKWKEIE